MLEGTEECSHVSMKDNVQDSIAGRRKSKYKGLRENVAGSSEKWQRDYTPLDLGYGAGETVNGDLRGVV